MASSINATILNKHYEAYTTSSYLQMASFPSVWVIITAVHTCGAVIAMLPQIRQETELTYSSFMCLKLHFVLLVYLLMMLVTCVNYICLWQTESQNIIKTNDASYYLNYVVNRLQEEEDRSEQCFDKSTTPLLIAVVEGELITAHMETLVEVQYCVVINKM